MLRALRHPFKGLLLAAILGLAACTIHTPWGGVITVIVNASGIIITYTHPSYFEGEPYTGIDMDGNGATDALLDDVGRLLPLPASAAVRLPWEGEIDADDASAGRVVIGLDAPFIDLPPGVQFPPPPAFDPPEHFDFGELTAAEWLAQIGLDDPQDGAAVEAEAFRIGSFNTRTMDADVWLLWSGALPHPDWRNYDLVQDTYGLVDETPGEPAFLAMRMAGDVTEVLRLAADLGIVEAAFEADGDDWLIDIDPDAGAATLAQNGESVVNVTFGD